VRVERKARLENCIIEANSWGSSKSLIMTAAIGMRARTHGGCPTMNTGKQQILQETEPAPKRNRSNGDLRTNGAPREFAARGNGSAVVERKPRVFVAADNRLLREAISRMLVRNGEIEVAAPEFVEPFRAEDLLKEHADILVLSSRGNATDDAAVIRIARTTAPKVRILLIGATGEESDFLQCVRAGVRGYLPRDASAKDVLEGVRALQAGEAVCPGTLCATLFRYLEREATSFPSATVHRRMGLTRREQQLIPLIAEGLTNKEIANHFWLSEQTVKNHLYRMRHKIGAPDRLGIVQVCQTQGFMP
jgi:DNA-binding NarL/FixJ family response regulator